MDTRRQIIRNVVLYVIGTYALSVIGGLIMAGGGPAADAGGLPFILGPIVMMVLLRSVGGDGWQDAGLGFRFRQNGGWYLFALLVYPITFGIVILLGMLLGMTTFDTTQGNVLTLFVAGLGAQVVPRTAFALCEEWGWRGYLEPRLSALGLADFPRHLLVGVIWAPWHFPLILATDYTDQNLAVYLPMFSLGVIIYAFVFGQVRRYSGTVWTAVLMHGVANTVGYALLDTNLLQIHNKFVADITSAGLLIILLWLGIAAWLLRRSRSLSTR